MTNPELAPAPLVVSLFALFWTATNIFSHSRFCTVMSWLPVLEKATQLEPATWFARLAPLAVATISPLGVNVPAKTEPAPPPSMVM